MEKVQHARGSWMEMPEPPISFADANAIVGAQAAAILGEAAFEEERCELSEALGRVLAADIVADRDQPPFARVTRDGFAVRAGDLGSRAGLRIIGELRAGEQWAGTRRPLAAGEAIEIMTGAALPPGADAVLMVEHAEVRPDGSVRAGAARTLAAGENVVQQGSEARRGDGLLHAGTRVRAAEIALAASCGLRSIAVYRQPAVAILATGDELVEWSADAPDRAIEGHRIYDSNSHMLDALVRGAHGVSLRQRAARDEAADLTASIRQGLRAAPLLLLTGGVSMGRYDLVEPALGSLGAQFLFTGVRIQPGKPVVFGHVPAGEGMPAGFFFGLPGNPVSAMVTFRIFVEPLLAAMGGERNWQPSIAMARLGSELRFKSGLTRFVPARLDTLLDVPTVTPVATQGSGDLAANAKANCHVMFPEDCNAIAAGEQVRVLLG